MLFVSASIRNGRAPSTQNITLHLPYLFSPQPLTVESLRGGPAGFVGVNTSTHREPSAFEHNTGYTTRGRWRGHGRRRAGAGASADVLAQPVRKQPVRRQPVHRHQAEVVVPK